MKWKKFLNLQAQYPHLAHDLIWRGVGMGDDHREFVRTKVGFIAFRKFEKLDLTAKATSSGEPLRSNYRYVQMERYESTNYQLICHVEGEDPGTRLRFVANDVGDGSIQAHIEDLMRWFEGCEVFRDRQLIWERVVKRTVKGSSYSGLTQMNLEIFPFPLHYRFKPQVLFATIPTNRAAEALI